MSQAKPHTAAVADRPEYRYHLLRAATERFQCGIAALSPQQRDEAERQARQTFALEELVLGSDEARDVIVPDSQVQAAYGEVQGRYADEDELETDLAHNGLDGAGLRAALRRELTFDAVMQRVGARHDAVAETDERLFYELHRERFEAPEQRAARHILITVNDDYTENTREAACTRLQAVADKLRCESRKGLTQAFARQARRASECPTAMEEGKLGSVKRGQLYPELDAVLFAMDEGEVSAVVESPIGFHLLLCEQIQPARTLPFNQVRERIHQALEQRRRREQQRAWIADLSERSTEPA
jgi:peptidyl-prolyl cis-trans isomerase C